MVLTRTLPMGGAWSRAFVTGLAVAVFTLGLGGASSRAGRISDIAATKHNFTAQGASSVKAVSEGELCVFCHTPHSANQVFAAPLWNRQLSGATYTPYTSLSLDATGLDQPDGSSKLCLSCHDGTLAIGAVDVLDGSETDRDPTTAEIQMIGTGSGGTVPTGQGTQTGFTRVLGTNLTNDHPISFTFNDALAAIDGELRSPSITPHIDNRVPGLKPEVPLENGKVQCISCHDPHIRDTVETDIKFLRLQRLQQQEPIEGTFDIDKDIICLACHDKAGWAGSTHANSFVADEIYTAATAAAYDFPANLPVWQAACINCHDAHTVQGSRRLLREGTDSLAIPKIGGNSAIEETCYQCHSNTGSVLLNQGTSQFPVPDIRTDFASPRHMPIADQPEVHDIGTGMVLRPGMDFIESQALLGKGVPTNRHVECTDCHNPHRLVKKRRFNDVASIPDASGTHQHEAGVMHTNVASGVLKGTWGIEPTYGSTAFNTNPTSYTVKRGNPPVGAVSDASNVYVTREYQVCLKCHSDYSYNVPPPLGASIGGTPSGTNALTRYTNQAMEFQAPLVDRGEPSGDHRSWHPVLDSTGRTTGLRQTAANNWLSPWNNNAFIGSQSMYCSDCHGSATGPGTVVPPNGENGNPWGPHGSIYDFILKGPWGTATGSSGSSDHLCFKCHDYTDYATDEFEGNRSGHESGFGGDKDSNLHAYHAKQIGQMRCTWCHVAVPHGWKNKAFLVNLNDVGPEAGLSPGTQVRNNTTASYTKEPYYLGALQKIVTFATSGNWLENDCGSAGAPGNGQTGKDWMRDSSENCQNPP